MIHFCVYDGLPCLVSASEDEAWQYKPDLGWYRIDRIEAGANAAVIGKEEFSKEFGKLPPLPKEAFAEEKTS
jgi:hypothetical protein